MVAALKLQGLLAALGEFGYGGSRQNASAQSCGDFKASDYHFKEREVAKVDGLKPKEIAQDLGGVLARQLPFWEALTQAQQQSLGENAKAMSFSVGEQIQSSTHSCVGVLLLQTGMLRVYLLSEEGREVTLYRLYAGDICVLSASCILQAVTFEVNIDVPSACEAVLLPSKVLGAVMQENLAAECALYKLATHRFSLATWTMQQILFFKFDRRLALFLQAEMQRTGEATLHMTHDQVARYMGSAREVVTRMLKYFATEGIVRLNRGTIEVRDKAALSRCAALSLME